MAAAQVKLGRVDAFESVRWWSKDDELVRSNPSPGVIVTYRGMMSLVVRAVRDVSVTVVARGRICTATRMPKLEFPDRNSNYYSSTYDYEFEPQTAWIPRSNSYRRRSRASAIDFTIVKRVAEIGDFKLNDEYEKLLEEGFKPCVLCKGGDLDDMISA